MVENHRILKQFLSGSFFLIVFAFYYSGITFIPLAHTHGDSNLVHSHPYKKDSQGNAGHTHTTAEFVLIAGLSHFISPDLAPSASITVAELVLSSLISAKVQSKIQVDAFKEQFYLRPPPTSLSF